MSCRIALKAVREERFQRRELIVGQASIDDVFTREIVERGIRHSHDVYDRTLGPEQRLESQPSSDLLRLVEALVAPTQFVKCGVAEARDKFWNHLIGVAARDNQSCVPSVADDVYFMRTNCVSLRLRLHDVRLCGAGSKEEQDKGQEEWSHASRENKRRHSTCSSRWVYGEVEESIFPAKHLEK